jgi:hypothetical protein
MSSSRPRLGVRGFDTGGLVTSGTGSGRNRDGSSDEADVLRTVWTGFGAEAAFGTFVAVEAASDANVVGGTSASIVGVGCKSTVATGAAFEADKVLPVAAVAVTGVVVDAVGDEAALSSFFPPLGKNIIVFLSDDLLSFAAAPAAIGAAAFVAAISLGKGITGASSLAAGSSITGTESPAALVDPAAEAPSGRKLAAFTEVFAVVLGEAEVTAVSKSAEAASPAAGNSVKSLSSGSVRETANGLALSVNSSL